VQTNVIIVVNFFYCACQMVGPYLALPFGNGKESSSPVLDLDADLHRHQKSVITSKLNKV